MTQKQLQTLIGRTALWNPAARAAKATLRVTVTIESVRSICGRSECLIVPTAGRGNAWVKRATLVVTKPKPQNLY